MASAPPLIYLIAGEASGDLLGARLMRAMKELTGGQVRFAGIGGEWMKQEGLQSLFPNHELSLIGFLEILPHLPRLLARIRETVEHIVSVQPDIVITIDSPGFCFRVAQAVRDHESLRGLRMVHYVAPSVWAYKPERAAKVARLYDHLLCLLPFEPPYFEKEGLAATFVGHPIVREWEQPGNGPAFRQAHGIAGEAPVICLLPGSRRGEVHRHLPVFQGAMERLLPNFLGLAAVAVAPAQVYDEVQAATAAWPLPVTVVPAETAKRDAFAASNVALAKSGTVTLELALANIPMVVTYKVTAVSAWMMRRMIRIPYVSLVNIILNQPVVPELLQEDCCPMKLAEAVTLLLRDKDTAARQVAQARQALDLLGMGAPDSPSHKAAKVVLGLIARP